MEPILSRKPDDVRRRDFFADRNGGGAVMFAVALLPLMAVVGSAVDYANALKTKAVLQTAVDAAVLAGANDQRSGGNPASTRKIAADLVASEFRIPGGGTASQKSA